MTIGISQADLRVLQRALEGELAEDDAELRVVLQRSGSARAWLAEARQTARFLDDAGALVRGEIAEALALGRDATAPTPRPEPVQARPRRHLAWLASAAAVLAAVVLVLQRTPRPPVTPQLLGSGIELLSPSGEAGAYDVFRWSYVLADGGYFRVRVVDPGGALLTESPECLEPQWRPTGTERAAWPDEIGWEVLAFDASNRLERTSPRARAHRSP